MNISSPITNSDDVTLLRTITASELILAWKNSLQIDITDELHNHKEIYQYQCNQTKLKFFLPLDVAGGDQLYQNLEKLAWYYMPRKWEHDMAIQDLKGSKKVLEVGCGKGDFVRRLCQEENLDAQGIELNSTAVESACKQNIPVSKISLYDLANQQSSQFDAVCTFQVLEHIAEPRRFLESLVKLVKPKGQLIISVPNEDSFIKYSLDNVLDLPPHHMTQWVAETFEKLPDFLPIKLKKICLEPLEIYHVDWYANTQINRFPKTSPKRFMLRVLYKLIKPFMKNFAYFRRLVIGHTLYVVFEKIDETSIP